MPQDTRILIKTFVLGANHGQFLQALGLKTLTQEILPHSKIYHPLYSNHFLKELYVHIKGLSFLKYIRFLVAWFSRFSFIEKNFSPDVCIYGSDMIFHLQSKIFPPDQYYFQKNKSSECSICYAPSTSWRDVTNEPSYVSNLRTFDCLSARDLSTYDLIYENTGRKPEIVIDPAFFVDLTYLNSIRYTDHLSNSSSNFHKCLIYGPPFKFKILQDAIDDFYPSSNIEYRYVAYFNKRSILSSIAHQLDSPLSILQKYYETDFVLTSTFHGVIMSLILKKPFLAIVDKNLSSRLSIYNRYYSSERIVNFTCVDPANICSNLHLLTSIDDIDFAGLEAFKNSSRNWYSQALLNRFGK